MSILIAVAGWDHVAWTDRIRAFAPDRKVIGWSADGTGDAYDPDSIDYIMTWHPPAGFLAKHRNLKFIASLGAGVDHVLKDPELPDVPLVRIVDPFLTSRMTEWITLQCLYHLRQHRLYEDQQRQRIWKEHPQPSARDVRVGIMGMGVLGQDAAEVLVRLGFQVAGWSRSAKTVDGVECFSGSAGFEAFLARTDILISLLPLTPETKGLVNRETLSKLPRDGALGGPVYINAGRGKQQVETDVAAALQDGTLTAASLDVFEAEPLPAESPLWGLSNCIITPHVAADSNPDDLARYLVRQVERFEAGKALENQVDLKRGY